MEEPYILHCRAASRFSRLPAPLCGSVPSVMNGCGFPVSIEHHPKVIAMMSDLSASIDDPDRGSEQKGRATDLLGHFRILS